MFNPEAISPTVIAQSKNVFDHINTTGHPFCKEIESHLFNFLYILKDGIRVPDCLVKDCLVYKKEGDNLIFVGNQPSIQLIRDTTVWLTEHEGQIFITSPMISSWVTDYDPMQSHPASKRVDTNGRPVDDTLKPIFTSFKADSRDRVKIELVLARPLDTEKIEDKYKEFGAIIADIKEIKPD